MGTGGTSGGPVGAASRLLDGRPLEVLALALLLLGRTVSLVLVALFPMSPEAPVELAAAFAAVSLAMAGVTLGLGVRFGRPLLLGHVLLMILLSGVLVSQTHTRVGMLVNGIAYAGVAAYVAIFFPDVVRGIVALSVVSFGAAVLLSDVDAMLAPWAVVSVAVALLGEVVSRVSNLVREHMHTDPLTGVLNRNGLDVAAAREQARGRRHHHPVTVVAIDLDGFKLVNDQRGHAAGDRLLADITSAWRGALRGEDILARTGGDEFVIVLPDCGPEDAGRVLERLRATHPASWSAGQASWEPDEELGSCLRRADEDLYAAKGARREASALQASATAG